jgi:hypothetical protein
VQALEGKACMMESEVSRLGRLRDPGQMGSRKREDAVHNEWMGRSDAQEPGSVSGAFGMVAWGNEAYFGIMSVHSVDFDVLFLNISFEIEER